MCANLLILAALHFKLGSHQRIIWFVKSIFVGEIVLRFSDQILWHKSLLVKGFKEPLFDPQSDSQDNLAMPRLI